MELSTNRFYEMMNNGDFWSEKRHYYVVIDFFYDPQNSCSDEWISKAIQLRLEM